MYLISLIVFLIYCSISGSSSLLLGGKNGDRIFRDKRADIDLQSCLENFNIHKDKIIRTQDSQNMGAKYLNEIDLGSREECLRLCCETEDCDVFVYEDKNAGSCYLFHCGPPEDFKCKFTHHVNYSSGVLAINRHLPDLESQIKLTKHEQDLTKLRKPEVEPELNGAVAALVDEVKTTPSTTTTTATNKEILPIPNDVKQLQGPTRKCSRFQFECRSTGECIGIYNACDGIPQCADGSDEAVELGCPDTLTTSPPIHSNNIGPQRFDNNMQQNKLIPPILGVGGNTYQSSGAAVQDPPQLVQLPQNQDADFLRPDPKNYNPRLQYDPQQLPPYNIPQVVPIQSGPQNWMNHQTNQMQLPQYGDKNSHIFNHKENGLQVPDGQEISKMQYSDGINTIREYPKMPNYYADNNYRQPIQQENWGIDDGRYIAGPNSNNNVNNRYIDKSVQDQINKKADQMQYKYMTSGEPNRQPEKENPQHVQEKMAHDLKHSKENMEHGRPKIKIEKHKIVHHEQYPDVVAYKLSDSNDLQDGIAQTPRGAVLSLTLGLIITCIMAILIGCRLKVVRRRMRRGGKSYAHDADYLVNGMYL